MSKIRALDSIGLDELCPKAAISEGFGMAIVLLVLASLSGACSYIFSW